MSEFEREERYIVIKRKHLDDIQDHHIKYWLRENNIPTVECVVVEADWPNYEHVWSTVEAVADGTWGEDDIQHQEALERLDDAMANLSLIRDKEAKAQALVACKKAYMELADNSASNFGFPADYHDVDLQLDWVDLIIEKFT